MNVSEQQKPSAIKIWLAAIRPATLTASFVPIIVGGSLAWTQGYQKPDVLFVCLLGALFIQIATKSKVWSFVGGHFVGRSDLLPEILLRKSWEDI